MKLYPDGPNELLILQKWLDSASLIAFRLISGSFELQVFGRISKVSAERIELTVLGDKVGWLSFDPSGAVFRYQDTSEADPSVKSDVESKAISALSVLLPSTEGNPDAWLYEWREEKS